MSTEKLKLEVLLALTEKVLKPLKSITSGSNDTAKALKATREQLRQLNDAQKRIDGFRKLDKDLAIVSNGMKGAQQRIKDLKAEIAKLPAPTKDMARALKEAQAEAGNLKGRYTTLLEKQQRLRTELNATGMDTKNLATHQRELAAKINTATAAVDKQVAAMKRENAQAQRAYAAQANYQKAMGVGNTLKSAGMNTVGIGIAGGLPIAQAVRQFASFEDAMLGVARQVNDAVDANGKLTPTYYEMGRAIQAMSERLPMTANDIAAIVEAGARMGIQGKQDLLAYAETTAILSTAFQLPVEQIGDNMAKVAQLYKVPIGSIKQLGDAINWLDDNSLAKGGDIIDVLQRIGGTATTLHMTYKEAAALGSTFLSLGNGAETAASASEHMMKQLAVASMLPKRFQGGMAMIGMNSRTVQNAMSTDALGTIVKVLEAINKLPQNQQIEAATRLFGKEFGPDASKLAGNLGELRRELELVNAEKSKGSADREMARRNQNLSSGYKELMSALRNLASDLGSTFKPELTSIMQSTAGVLKGVRAWVREHPGLTGALMKSAAVLAIIVTTVGALIFAVGALIAPIALLRLGMTLMGIKAGALFGGLWSLVSPVAKLALVFSLAYGAGTYLAGWIDGFVSRIMGAKTTLGAAIFDIVQLFKNGEWSQIGMLIVRGIFAGIDALTGGLLGKVTNLAARMIAAAKSAFGIKSPSTVFAAIGQYTMAGLSNGIERSQAMATSVMARAAKKVAAVGAGMLIGGTALATMPAAQLPTFGNATRSITERHQGLTLPALPDAVRNLRDIRRPAALAGIDAATRTIIDRHQGISLPAVPDVTRRIRDVYLPAAFNQQQALVSNAIDTRPPLSAGRASVSEPMQVNIQIHQAPGQSAQDLAQEVKRALLDIETQRAARSRSHLGDRD
ncbi:MAG: phage tail tape measure protein [Georgfuchsia sp.]